MSRIGNKSIDVPQGVTVSVADQMVTVKGPKGELRQALVNGIEVSVEDGRVVVARASNERFVRAMQGTLRSLINNMIIGVSQGYVKKLEIIGVGYRAQLQGRKLVLNVGFCHPVELEAPIGVDFTCPDQTHVEVAGIDKRLVGEIAANIRAVRKPEPYKGKGIRYQGEFVRRKAGKSAK